MGTKTGTYSKAYFRDYLDMLDKHEVSIFNDYDSALKVYRTQQQSQQRRKQPTNWHQYIDNVRSSSTSHNERIAEYLEYFCEHSQASLKEYYTDFKPIYLHSFEKKWKVYLAKDGLTSLDQSEISLDYYKQMQDSVSLEFSKKNKEQFDVSETVELEVVVKNIKLLHVKVFEFNTETYYKKNL